MAEPSPPLQSPSHVPLLNKETLGSPKTPATTFTEPPSPTDSRTKQPSIEGALPDLLYGAFLPCLPVAVVSAVLLTLIFYYQVKLDPGYALLQTPTNETNNLAYQSFVTQISQFESTGGAASYYTTTSPAILATIAAWTSKIIPFVTSTSMAVVAFFAGRRILNATKDSKTGQLPTPHQISILINLLSGSGVKPLYDTVLYRLQNHERLVQPIPLAFSALSFVVIMT